MDAKKWLFVTEIKGKQSSTTERGSCDLKLSWKKAKIHDEIYENYHSHHDFVAAVSAINRFLHYCPTSFSATKPI